MFKSSTASAASARTTQTNISRVQNHYTLEVSATFVLVHIKSESGKISPSFSVSSCLV